MGLVFLAEDPSLNRQVAIKMLDIMADSDGDREFLRSRLLRDARAAAVLSHPNIVGVYDIVEEGESVYVVMEYIEGESLASFLDNTPIPDRGFTMRVLQQVAAGLDYTHKKGIIHRDIKPGNIMTGASGVAKILDFGIARMTDVRTSTPTGLVMGTVDYMAPEQIKAAMIDGRADQFSLAAVAYRMISGSTLFGRHTLATLTYKLVNESPQPVCEQNTATPAAVDRVLAIALAKSPSERFASCGAFVEALAQAFDGVLAPTATLRVKPQDAATGTAGKRRKTAPLVAAGVAGVVLLAAGGGAIALWKPWSRGANSAPVAAQTPAAPPVQKPSDSAAIQTKKPAEEPPRLPAKTEATGKPPVMPQKQPDAKASVPVKAPVQPADNSAKTPESPFKKQERATVLPPVPVKPEPPVKPPERAAFVPPPAAVKESEATMNTPDALPPPLPPNSPAAKETPVRKGQEAMKAKDFPEAIRNFSKAIELHPKLPRAYVDRGLAYQMSNQFAKAIQDYSDAIRLGSRDAHAYANRGICEVRLHEDDLALADFNRTLEMESDFPAALNGRGGVFFRRRQYKLAINDFSAAIRGNPKFVQAYQNRANARKATGDLAGAADDFAVIQRLQRNK
jgi:serine/threonine-protein kinase